MTDILTKNRTIGLIIALVIFAADQWIKWIVDSQLAMKLGERIDLLPFFALHRVHNYGVSMGMFTATSPEMRWGLVLLTALIAVVVFVWMLREKAFGDILGLSLILGGALGNIVDRFNMGYVLDFADFHIGGFSPFLVFNVADAAITIGVVIILARSFFVRDKDSTNTSEPANTAVES
ncbi:signal peptidase II [Pontixanthobacter gangjinensis]|uniref:Lipoprotein signal peptidase n=1 Tax=Pontixanthobacter gangjinensis TaxID=1028742 RepID=A0A6I4SK89_9SPHN|nr:signal peptidase II [Pontixanthobacter gangjinensis]MXO55606.1 signal peptidase II [Pontixanthobacter gangjinensis]